MKKKFYFATLVIAALSFTGCANDEYVGDQQNLGEQNGAIAFSTKSENTVRGGNLQGESAAKKLHNQFWVYGTKTVKDNNNDKEQIVFDNYRVEYKKDSKSSSNTKGWEYVGKGENNKTQTIKYWDYSASKYDFEAYSYYNTENGSVNRIESLTAQNGTALNNGLAVGDYVVGAINETGCSNLYFADKMTVTPGINQKAVELKFKSVLSKIRVGFYETIPGYSVRINAFYQPNGENPTDFDAANKNTNQFVAWCPNNQITGSSMSFVVSYNNTTPDKPTPAVTKVWNESDKYIPIDNTDGETYKLKPKLTLGSNLLYSQNENNEIGTKYSEVTWDQGVNSTLKYTYVIPQDNSALYSNTTQTDKVQPMRIKVDYTLKSEDSEETIEVTGATAIVPAEYLRWAPNTAYSYVFKISDNTNGTTGGEGDPAGLYPITFDAVVEDMAESTDHLTTVSDLSITATQGKQFAEADKAVFKTGEAINVKVMQYVTEEGVLKAVDRTSNVGASTLAPGDSFKAVFVEVANYNSNKSLDEYLNELSPEYEYVSSASPEYIKLPSKSEAGYWIVKVTFRENTGSVNRDITKYAVLKVG